MILSYGSCDCSPGINCCCFETGTVRGIRVFNVAYFEVLLVDHVVHQESHQKATNQKGSHSSHRVCQLCRIHHCDWLLRVSNPQEQECKASSWISRGWQRSEDHRQIWRYCQRSIPSFQSFDCPLPLYAGHQFQYTTTLNILAQTKVPKDIDYIVIGSGISGLATAACLSRVGRRVLVLEQHDRIGGSLHQYSKGYQV